MSVPAFYLHKADQCARLADAATPDARLRFEDEREVWLGLLAEEIGIGSDEAVRECLRKTTTAN